MPIRFVCPSCRQVLSVGRRKAGSAIACPRCGSGTIVPSQSMVGATGKGDSEAWGSAEMPAAGFEDVNELLGEAPLVQPSIRPMGGNPPAGYGNGYGYRPSVGSPGAAPLANAAGGNLLLVSRAAIYAQAALFVAVAIVAFAGGYLVGRDQAPASAAATGAIVKAERVRMHGIIEFEETSGRIVDDGAVIIALPATAPNKKFGARGLRPDDAADDAAAAKIREIGGDYARADDDGAYELVVDADDYFVLIISRHATKPAGMSSEDLNRLAKYFEVAPDMVGTYQYVLLSETISGNSALLNHTFGRNTADK